MWYQPAMLTVSFTQLSIAIVLVLSVLFLVVALAKRRRVVIPESDHVFPQLQLTSVVSKSGSSTERAFIDQFSDEDELARHRRRAAEYFDVIERIEKERDEMWEMYRVEVSEHLNAQALLERRLMETRLQLARAIKMLNKMREAAELEPVKSPKDLKPYEGEPVGAAKKYADEMIALCEGFQERVQSVRPEMVDGATERDEISDS